MKPSSFVNKPPSKWEAAFRRMKQPTAQRLADELSAMAVAAAMASAYLEHRCGHGCGDQGHEDSVRHTMKVRRGVRKALGYSYPAHGEFSF